MAYFSGQDLPGYLFRVCGTGGGYVKIMMPAGAAERWEEKMHGIFHHMIPVRSLQKKNVGIHDDRIPVTPVNKPIVADFRYVRMH
ncbi:MAG: hypothetical protein WCX63_07415 [Methanoregula sp.]